MSTPLQEAHFPCAGFRNSTISKVEGSQQVLEPPLEYICPVLGTLMTTPVISTRTGLHYEEAAISALQILQNHTLCPVTGIELGNLIPDRDLQKKILLWRKQLTHQQNRRRRCMMRRYHQQQLEGRTVRLQKTTAKKRTINFAKYDDKLLHLIRVQTQGKIEENVKKTSREHATKNDVTKRTQDLSRSIFSRGPSLFLT